MPDSLCRLARLAVEWADPRLRADTTPLGLRVLLLSRLNQLCRLNLHLLPRWMWLWRRAPPEARPEARLRLQGRPQGSARHPRLHLPRLCRTGLHLLVRLLSVLRRLGLPLEAASREARLRRLLLSAARAWSLALPVRKALKSKARWRLKSLLETSNLPRLGALSMPSATRR